ncbi:unnamed protein product [Ectocarpus fasciculatus]
MRRDLSEFVREFAIRLLLLPLPLSHAHTRPPPRKRTHLLRVRYREEVTAKPNLQLRDSHTSRKQHGLRLVARHTRSRLSFFDPRRQEDSSQRWYHQHHCSRHCCSSNRGPGSPIIVIFTSRCSRATPPWRTAGRCPQGDRLLHNR